MGIQEAWSILSLTYIDVISTKFEETLILGFYQGLRNN